MSEVLQLRRQIELEIWAMDQALNGYRMASRHAFINHALEQTWDYLGKLPDGPEKQHCVEETFAVLEQNAALTEQPGSIAPETFQLWADKTNAQRDASQDSQTNMRNCCCTQSPPQNRQSNREEETELQCSKHHWINVLERCSGKSKRSIQTIGQDQCQKERTSIEQRAYPPKSDRPSQD